MKIEQFFLEGLGHQSYFVAEEGSGAAAVVDPRRDIDIYLEAASRTGLKITHILETHVHNDYVSGGRELASKVGAKIIASDIDPLVYADRSVRDGDRIELGKASIQVLGTPGHTPEHVSYLLFEPGSGTPTSLFSGGSMLVGNAGRTDLLGPDYTLTLTKQQYASLRRLLDHCLDRCGCIQHTGLARFVCPLPPLPRAQLPSPRNAWRVPRQPRRTKRILSSASSPGISPGRPIISTCMTPTSTGARFSVRCPPRPRSRMSVSGSRWRRGCAWSMGGRTTPVGFVVGALSGFFGIGGGFLIVPGLIFATSMPLLNAIGTSLFSVGVFGTTTAVTYALSGLVNWLVALEYIGGGVLGGLLGARLATHLGKQKKTLARIFAGVIIVVAIYMLYINLTAIRL